MICYSADIAGSFGYRGDRWPRKGLTHVSGVTFWSAGTILSWIGPRSIRTLLACRVLVGLGEASYAVLAPTRAG